MGGGSGTNPPGPGAASGLGAYRLSASSSTPGNPWGATAPIESDSEPCSVTGHVVDGDSIATYADRMTVGYCKFCGDRVSLTAVSGGNVAVWARGRAMGESTMEPSAESLTRLQETKALLERDQVALQEALDLVELMILKAMP